MEEIIGKEKINNKTSLKETNNCLKRVPGIIQ